MNTERNTKRNPSVDCLKGISILFIMLTHFSWSDNIPHKLLFQYWVDMAVPIFMILSGYVYALSYKRKSIEKLSQAYNIPYILEKMIRYIFPYLIAFVVEFIYRYYFKKHTFVTLSEWISMFLHGGVGPGAYYVPIMIQLVFLFPLIFFMIRKLDYIGLISSFILCFLFEIIQHIMHMDPEVYRFLIFRYLFAIVAGCYLAIGRHQLSILIASVSSCVGAFWIFLLTIYGYNPMVVMPAWGGVQASSQPYGLFRLSVTL